MLLVSSSGWWFCQCESKRGWIPASYLEPLDGPDESEEAEPDYEGKRCVVFGDQHVLLPLHLVKAIRVPAGELHMAAQAYRAEQEDEISLDLGETVEVIHKLLDGWWVVRYPHDAHTEN